MLSLRGPLCAGEAFILRRLLRRAAARARRGAPVRPSLIAHSSFYLSIYGIGASLISKRQLATAHGIYPTYRGCAANYVVGLRPSRGAADTQREAEKLTRQGHDDRKEIEKKRLPGRLLAYLLVRGLKIVKLSLHRQRAQSRVRVRNAVPVSETVLRSCEVEIGSRAAGAEEVLP